MSQGPSDDLDSADVSFPATPLFPLPGVVLFPRAVLPLHIFEERYKAMTAEALGGSRQIAMALLCSGWEKTYYGRPEIEPVVCVGEILTHEQLADGKYNFFLRGVARARVVREWRRDTYRVADLQKLPETAVPEVDLRVHRDRMTELLSVDLAALLPGAPQFVEMLGSPLPTAAVADLIAFHLLDDVAVKLELLADTDVARRVGRVVSALEGLEPPAQAMRVHYPRDPSLN